MTTTTIELPHHVASPIVMESSADEALTLAGDLRTATAELKNARDDLRKNAAPEGWTGASSQAAEHQATRIAGSVDVACAAFDNAAAAADAFEDQLRKLETSRNELVDRRTDVNRDIDALKSAIDSTPNADEDRVRTFQSEAANLRRRVETLETRIAAWERDHEAAEAAFVAALAAVDTLAEGEVAAKDPNRPDIDALVAQLRAYERKSGDADPKAVKSWWDLLSAADRQALITEYPTLVGSMDGIPAVDRDEANRILLDHYLAEDPDRKGLKELAERISGENGEEYHVLLLDPEGDGKAIVAYGNPDTADNVATLLPGMGTTLDSADTYLDRIERTRQAAERIAPDEATATIWWEGYDAPDAMNPSVMTDGDAEEGAGELDDFVDGLRATHDGSFRNTALAHSYGGTLFGVTARDHGIDVDGATFLGSVGIAVDDVEDLGLDPETLQSAKGGGDWSAKYFDWGAGAGSDPEDAGVPTFDSDSSGHSGYWGDKKTMEKVGEMIVGPK